MILAFDQGTTSSRSILFDRNGSIHAVAQQEFTQHFPKPGWVEHEPNEIWASQIVTAKRVLREAGVPAADIVGIGITNQRETTLLWDKATGEPVHNAIVWQDRRTARFCDTLKADGHEQLIRDTTGLVVDAYFSGTKIRWLLDNVPGARAKAERGELLFGTVDTWLIWKLTGGAVHATDHTNASRTLLYDIRARMWSDAMLELLDVPRAILPDIRSSSGDFGHTAADILGAALPIAGVAGDQQAALFGQACTSAGLAKNTYGTGCFMLLHTGEEPVVSQNNLLTTVACGPDGSPQYALEGSVFVAGAAIQWLRDGLQLFDSASESEAIARTVDDAGGVYVVPAFVGLGAPYWDSDARGAIYGLTRGTTKAHLVRATLESLAYQTRDVLDAMQKDAGLALETLRVDGGASANNLMMQFQSDILGVPVERPDVLETTALGAAYLAGLHVEFYEQAQTSTQSAVDARFEPSMDQTQRDTLYAGWQDAIGRTRTASGG
ncbi:MAG: glycerol kinase GlpK [Bacteroidota bacterium]